MPGKGAKKRSDALSIRCYNLRNQGLTLTEIAETVGIDKEKVRVRIILGERLVSLIE